MEDKEIRRILDNADDCEIYGIWVLTKKAGRTTEQLSRLEKHVKNCKRCQGLEQFIKSATSCQIYQRWLNITDYWLTKEQVAELNSHINSCDKCKQEELRVGKAAQCKLYRMWIWGSLDEELEADSETELKKHLAKCLLCSNAYAEAREIKDAVRKVELPQPSKGLDAKIRKSLELTPLEKFPNVPLGSLTGLKAEQTLNSQLATHHSPLSTPHSPLPTPHSALPTRNSQLTTRNSLFYRFRYAVGAAALVLMALLLTIIPTRSPLIPEALARSAELHDQYTCGKVELSVASDIHSNVQSYFGQDVSIPVLNSGTKLMGGCRCELTKKDKTAPWIIYKDRSGIPLSLFILDKKVKDIPESAKRTYNGRGYSILTINKYRLIVCDGGSGTHLWVSSLEEDEMLKLILSTRQGKGFFRGEKVALSGVTCEGCCSTVLSCVRAIDGVEDAEIDMVSMELVVSYNKDKLRLADIIEAIKKVGYSAEEKR